MKTSELASFEDVQDATKAAQGVGEYKLAAQMQEDYRLDLMTALCVTAEGQDYSLLSREECKKKRERVRQIETSVESPTHGLGEGFVRMLRALDALQAMRDVCTSTVFPLPAPVNIQEHCRRERHSTVPFSIYDSLHRKDPHVHREAASVNELFVTAHNLGHPLRTNRHHHARLLYSCKDRIYTCITGCRITTYPPMPHLNATIDVRLDGHGHANILADRLLGATACLDLRYPGPDPYCSVRYRNVEPLPEARIYVHIDGWEILRAT